MNYSSTYFFGVFLWKRIVAFMHIYVTVWCLGMCVGMLTYKCSVHVCVHGELRTWRWKSPAITLHLMYSCTVSQLNPELIWLVQPASLLRGPLSLPSIGITSGLPFPPAFCVGQGIWTLILYPCTKSALATESSALLSPFCFFFFFTFLGEEIIFTYF